MQTDFIMKNIQGFLQTTRAVKSLAVALLLSFFATSFFYGIGAFFFLLFSFAFNDWVDAKKDAIGHPLRAIPSGKITRNEGLFFSIVLIALGISWSLFFLSEYIVGFITIYFLSVLYSLILKPNLAVIATPVWSIAVAILFVQPFADDLLVYIAVAGIVYGYETLLDYRDRKADAQFSKTPTLAIVLGEKSYILSILTFILGGVFLGLYFLL